MPAYKTFAHRFRATQKRTLHAKTMGAAVTTARRAWGQVELVAVQFAATKLWWAFPAEQGLAQTVIATGAMNSPYGPIALTTWERVGV